MTSYVAGLNPFDLETVDTPEMPQTGPDMAATSVPAHISIASSRHTDDTPCVQPAPPAAVDPPLPHPADADAGTIRADFAQSIDANAVHGSDSTTSAAREISYFFSAEEICS